jgi:hypothetical protein
LLSFFRILWLLSRGDLHGLVPPRGLIGLVAVRRSIVEESAIAIISRLEVRGLVSKQISCVAYVVANVGYTG